MDFSWLPDGTEASVRDALAAVAPELATAPLVVRPRTESNPRWWSSTAIVDGDLFVKFAWGQPAAERLYREVVVVDALADQAASLRLPPVAFSCTSPLLLATGKVEGSPLTYDHSIGLDEHDTQRAGSERARFLAALHAPSVLERVQGRHVQLGAPEPQGDTAGLRQRFPNVVTGRRRSEVSRWCDWVDHMLESPAHRVLVHGDLHVHNQLWDLERLQMRAVVDYEHVAVADPAYDFRYLPREYKLFVATVREYEQLTGAPLDVPRVMAWHILTSLGDALWRAEAGHPMPAGGTTPDEWFDLVADRLDRLGIKAS